MIVCRGRSGKDLTDRFAPPPWDASAAPWQAIDAQLPPDHLARRIAQGVQRLDLAPLLASYGGRGSQAYRPDLLLKVVLFEIQRGRPSPAQWYVDAQENIAVQWLGFGIRPARSVWYAFAFRIHRHLDGWNAQVLRQAQEQGQLAVERVALDGTTVEANASRHRLLNHEQVQQRRQALAEVIRVDTDGSAPPARPSWMANTPDSRRRQQQQYDVAQARLAQRLAENRRRIPSERREEKHVRISVSDPEAALGKDKHKVFRPLYNVQYVRDLDSPFVVAYDVFARGSDAGTLVPMLTRTEQLCGRRPGTALVDSGYVTALDLADAQEWGVALYGPWKENDYSGKEAPPARQWGKDVFHWDEGRGEYRCPAGQPLKRAGVQARPRSLGRTEKVAIYRAEAATCAACPLKPRCCPQSRSGRNLGRSEHEALIEAHRRKMETPEAKALYKLRRQTVEPSFGDAKEHRHFRRVNGRGQQKASAHTALTVLAHNLLAFVKGILGVGPPQPTG
jgi:hypothetical protein